MKKNIEKCLNLKTELKPDPKFVLSSLSDH